MNINSHVNDFPVNTEGYIHASGLWVINPNNEILLARRPQSVSTHRGLWGIAITGAMEEIDRLSYRNTVLREAAEELNLTDIDPEHRATHIQDDPPRVFALFLLRREIALSNLVLDREEVDEVAWVPKSDLQRSLVYQPDQFHEKYTPLVEVCLDVFADD